MDDSGTSATGGTGGPCAALQGDGLGCAGGGDDRCDGRRVVGSAPDEAPPGAVLGGGGCDSGGAVAPWLALGLVAALLRRTRWLGPVVLLGLCGRAAAVDVEHFDPDPGGTWAALPEGDLGGRWAIRVGLAASLARHPAVLRVGEREIPWVDWLGTTTGSASLNLGRFAQLAVLAPYHPLIVEQGRRFPAAPGDRSLRFTVPLSNPDARTQLTWGIGLDFPTGAPRRLLSDDGTVSATGALDHAASDAVRVGGALGVHLRQPAGIPGGVWGRSLDYGLGVAWSARPRLRLTAEAAGSFGLELPTVSTLPLELYGAGRVAVTAPVGLRLGGGVGIGHGLGNPQWRLLLAVDVTPPGSDRDLDGRPDVRDLCPRRPEDLDRYHDLEGCPDPDNDRDAILDPDDRCPLVPEVVNGWADADGCPDELGHVVLELAGDVDHAMVWVGPAPPIAVVGGDEATVDVEPGNWTVEAHADGFFPRTVRVSVPEGTVRVSLALEPLPDGAVVVRVTDEAGAPVVAWVAACDDRVESLAGTARVRCRPGPTSVDVRADGFDPASADVVVPELGDVALDVVLQRPPVAMVGQQLVVGDRIRFGTDDDRVEGSDGALEALAAWLRAHPEVRVLRIEGHADDPGSPAYNLDLSERRAASVVEALVARGVDPARLRALGSGESRRAGDEAAERLVEFLVLVWDEALAADAPIAP